LLEKRLFAVILDLDLILLHLSKESECWWAILLGEVAAQVVI